MPYDPVLHHRRSIRLRGYDYTQPGAYYITIVTHHRACIFGEIINGMVRLNEWGGVAEICWRAIPDHFPIVELDEFIIMPNHVHGIITIMECVNEFVAGGAQHCCAPPAGMDCAPTTKSPNPHVVPGSIGAIIRSYKSAVATRINQIRGTSGAPVWQRNYWDHILRNEHDLIRIRDYICNNPLRWQLDAENKPTCPAKRGG